MRDLEGRLFLDREGFENHSAYFIIGLGAGTRLYSCVSIAVTLLVWFYWCDSIGLALLV